MDRAVDKIPAAGGADHVLVVLAPREPARVHPLAARPSDDLVRTLAQPHFDPGTAWGGGGINPVSAASEIHAIVRREGIRGRRPRTSRQRFPAGPSRRRRSRHRRPGAQNAPLLSRRARHRRHLTETQLLARVSGRGRRRDKRGRRDSCDHNGEQNRATKHCILPRLASNPAGWRRIPGDEDEWTCQPEN